MANSLILPVKIECSAVEATPLLVLKLFEYCFVTKIALKIFIPCTKFGKGLTKYGNAMNASVGVSRGCVIMWLLDIILDGQSHTSPHLHLGNKAIVLCELASALAVVSSQSLL